MAVTNYGVNDAEAVKLWSRKLFREALNQTFYKRFMGDNTNSIIQILDDTSKGPGDGVHVILRMQLNEEGVAGDDTLEGQEEKLVTHTDTLYIDQLRHAVRSKGRMTEQRIPFSIRNEARLGLQDWWSDRIDTWIANQLAGNNAQSNTKYTGMQAVTAPDSNHHMWPSSKTTDEDLSSTAADRFSLSLIDRAVERAKTLDVPIRPLMMDGAGYYICVLHPYQVTDLRTSTDTGQWLDIQKAALSGGQATKNPIFTGALGMYNQTLLFENNRQPTGVNSSTDAAVSTVRRAVFCGAQAAVFGTGRDEGPNEMTWVEELFDYKNQLGVSAGMIGGAKRTIFNSESFGSVVISTNAESH